MFVFAAKDILKYLKNIMKLFLRPTQFNMQTLHSWPKYETY